MCSHRRCPESMWLFNNSWHENALLEPKNDYDLDPDYVINPVEKPKEQKYDADSEVKTLD